MIIRTWLVAGLIAAILVAPTTSAQERSEPITVQTTRLVEGFCDLIGSRPALSLRAGPNREALRGYRGELVRLRAERLSDWQTLPEPLQRRADRVIEARRCT